MENELWILKLPEAALKDLLRVPERYARFCFDATQGLGRLFLEQLTACARNMDECPIAAHSTLVEQLLTTLKLTLQQDERVLKSESSNIGTLHLARVERHVLQNLGDPELSPQSIAQACNLSLRYLHKLFSSTPCTLREWVRKQRLESVYRQLRNPQCHLSIGQLAFQAGFSDQAQFTRAFRILFGSTAREVRTASALDALQASV
jgi:AraC-like DNA-binding protein